ncbi:hypothetical protein F53441_112 [Fusarium austroafricanum]|uniref:Uncharacterized protein n=1 Tax=Fusarium austroafricanum TaxID=2364996 RepID=A0A8H4KYR3_9HYPO|nr:hypothetical protein F53441_112 [Fusarium austroafricanum]
MHSSWFSYAITKPYPFRWFTPVTVVGGIILTVLFTILNLGSTGYYLKPIFTEDPNGTTTQALQWFMRPPLNWDRNIQPKCQPKMLTVGDRFFTTNLGFQYSIKSITKYDNDSQAKISYPSIPYMNNTLEDCYLDRAQFTPLIWESLQYTRILSSLVAVDLGNKNAPNLLLEKDNLQYAILPPDDPNRKKGGFLNGTSFDGSNVRWSSIPAPGSSIPPQDGELVLLNETYAKFEDQMGPLEVKNATIVSQYLCSVPQSKSPGFMILAIVLANLVFLQASWTVLNLVAGGFLSNSQKTVCQGCSGEQRPMELTENLPKDGSSRGSYVGVSIEEGTESQLLSKGRRGSDQDGPKDSMRNLVHGL